MKIISLWLLAVAVLALVFMHGVSATATSEESTEESSEESSEGSETLGNTEVSTADKRSAAYKLAIDPLNHYRAQHPAALGRMTDSQIDRLNQDIASAENPGWPNLPPFKNFEDVLVSKVWCISVLSWESACGTWDLDDASLGCSWGSACTQPSGGSIMSHVLCCSCCCCSRWLKGEQELEQ